MGAADQSPKGMSTSLFHFLRAATAPDGKGLAMEGAVQPPPSVHSMQAGFPAGGGNLSRMCPAPVLPDEVQGLVTGIATSLTPAMHAARTCTGRRGTCRAVTRACSLNCLGKLQLNSNGSVLDS